MSNFNYWPYDEVSLESSANLDDIVVKTPWLTATTNKARFSQSLVPFLSSKLHGKSLSPQDIPAVNEFFKHFHQLPFAYILPTPKLSHSLDAHHIKDQCLLHENIKEILSQALKTPLADEQPLSCIEVESVLHIIDRNDWQWDHEGAIAFATINNSVHPESLFSIARRFHLLELIENDSGKKDFQSIKKFAGEQFLNAIARVVRQNHYVTLHCQKALLPALLLAQSASAHVQEFIDEERDHDKILSKALRHLGFEPNEIPVMSETKALMLVLHYCAHRNFLAFTMAIDAFERSNYQEVDPMAKLLEEKGFNDSARFINLHMKINDEGGHENVALNFLQHMDLCSPHYAQEALRLMELISLLMCSITKSTYRSLLVT
ncbi:MAG: iron-containing redox enzyme family protein [Myxococcales bacterium]|nr:iron-containing redox enzyme family protein [Myxococcales bacterium]USN51459.1 MAG: iron-containing redox enzyme family protein [Myxococcales bacterium]